MKKLIQQLTDEYTEDLLAGMLEKAKDGQDIVDYRMMLAAKISKAIKAKGWSKTEFAEAMDVKSASIITKWLSGTNNFEADTLYKIGKVLGIRLLNTSDEFNITGKAVILSDETSFTDDALEESSYNSSVGISGRVWTKSTVN